MSRLRLHRLLWLRVAALAIIFSLVSAAAVAARELRIEDFHSDIVVMPDGSIDVTENIRVHFIGGPWHGVYRSIPVEYVSPQDLTYTLFLDIKKITDADGRTFRYESSRERHYRKLKIYVPNADDSTQTISIEYTVSDGLRFFDDHDELYWNVTGDEWDVPIQAASARIVLPVGTTNIRANAFTGGYRSRAQNADTEIAGNGAEIRTRGPLGIHEGLTIAVAFDKGFVHEPTVGQKVSLFFRSNWPLFAPILGFGVMFYLWWTRGRDPRLRPIAAQYEPPDKLTPGEAGTLVDSSVNMRDITASIVDLAVRGYIVIEEHQKDQFLGLLHRKDYNFIVKKDRAEWANLKDHEQELLGGIFVSGKPGESVAMSSLENHFYVNLPSIKNSLMDSLVEHGYFLRRPDSVRSGYIAVGFILGLLIGFGGISIGQRMGMAPLTFILAGVLTGGIICAFGWFMPAHTEQGTRALENLLGFEDFLVHVDAERFNRMVKTPEMFEKFLPFAMALGVEKNWSKAFQDIVKQPPDWYRGSSYGPNFYPMTFANDMSYMSSMTSSAMSSAPRSSGGSGFSGGGGGGGFSGGGFGGGGGGGF